MIITQTPLRISFAGGGTDFEGYYAEHGGVVLSSAIDKYIYVVIKERFDDKIRVGYTRTEMVDDVGAIEHELVRECLRLTGITHSVEIATMADIPSEGSGLGSSSTVTVGLLHALYTYAGELVTPERLAEEACHIEIDVLGKPIGKQDQYIAAFGGLRHIQFGPGADVRASRVDITEEGRRRFSESLMLFYTGATRQASTILSRQQAAIGDNTPLLGELKAQVSDMERHVAARDFDGVGAVMHRGWQLKKQMASGISSPTIDEWYAAAQAAGAGGGKVAGAGGGGFLLLCCPPERRAAVRASLPMLKELPFSLERDGAKVILNARR